MDIFELPINLQDDALKAAERGMGYQDVVATYGSFSQQSGLLVAGLYFLPITMTRLDEAKEFRDERRVFLEATSPTIKPFTVSGLNKTGSINVLTQKRQTSSLIQTASQTPPFSTKTVAGDVFYRLSPFKNDRRITTTGGLVAASYSTTKNDFNEVPSGLAAVGRYALPSRLPAVHVFQITPTAGTSVSYGKVTPNYGMCGGGVEAYFPQGTNPRSVRYYKQIDMK